MDSNDLTAEQLESMMAHVAESRTYLRRLAERIHARGFPADDRLVVLTSEAHAALDRLWAALHYQGCEGKAGR